jgi:transcriptional antiterminator RfaH
MTADVQPRWIVVQTHSRAENKAVLHLTRQGFATYLPRYRKRRRHARKVDMVPAPLFPGYLFVAVAMAAQRWRSIASTVGITRLVSNGSEPAPVPEQVIAMLRAREDESGFVRLERTSQFSIGDKVRVMDGVFTSCLGLVDGMVDAERIAILLELLGRKSRVILDTESIAAA